MIYEFTFRLTTDLPLNDLNCAHVREIIADEISERIGNGILNSPDESEDEPEVRLLMTKPVRTDEIFFDGTRVTVFSDDTL